MQGDQNNMIHCQILEMFRKNLKPHFLFSTNDLCDLSAYYQLEYSICIWKYDIEIYNKQTNKKNLLSKLSNKYQGEQNGQLKNIIYKSKFKGVS